MPRSADLSRRRLLAGGVAVVAAATLAACGSSDSGGATAAEGSATPSAGPWSYTDDLGQTVTLDKTPVRIAAYGDAGAALWHFGVTPVAIFTWMDPANDTMFDDFDL
jgi:iron complex transport system substrate-binding protein